MPEFLRKYTVVTPIVLLLLGASFLLRDDISRILTFGPDTSPHDVIGKLPDAAGGLPVGNGDLENIPSGPAAEKPVQQAPSVPSYTGREPTEFRPVPEEVRLFTEDQKRQLFETLETHGRAVKADPTFFSAWIQLGVLKKTIGDFIGARDAWEYAGVIQPLNSLSFANLGELYWRYLHDYPKAEANLKISIKHKADDFQTYITLAELYHYSMPEKKDLADDVLLDGIKANPGSDTLMRRLAYLYEQRKEYGLALEWWEKVLAQNPEDQSVVDSINRLRNKLISS